MNESPGWNYAKTAEAVSGAAGCRARSSPPHPPCAPAGGGGGRGEGALCAPQIPPNRTEAPSLDNRGRSPLLLSGEGAGECNEPGVRAYSSLTTTSPRAARSTSAWMRRTPSATKRSSGPKEKRA